MWDTLGFSKKLLNNVLSTIYLALSVWVNTLSVWIVDKCGYMDKCTCTTSVWIKHYLIPRVG